MNGWPPPGQVPEVVADDDEKGSFQVIILVRGRRTNGAGATRGMDALHEWWKLSRKSTMLTIAGKRRGPQRRQCHRHLSAIGARALGQELHPSY
jgi:hypothetical protein